MEYNFSEIENKWKEKWARDEVYKVMEDTSRPKFYVLDMFPYPSGSGLHVGHPLGYVASDIYARYKRLKGFNVLHPMGYDAFGLPAEQYAIETGTHPVITTEKAIKRYREQLDKIGFSFDWSREVKTSDPKYYKWTQWMFLKLFNSWYNRTSNKAESIDTLIAIFEKEGSAPATGGREGVEHFTAEDWRDFDEAEKQQQLMHYRLAFLSYAEVNWCPALGTVLANDEVKDGKSERGGHPVERRKMRQWFLRITEYSDRLLEGLERLDWSDSMKEMQRNWIGRSEGALVKFRISDLGLRNEQPGELTVFTTRPDTIFGATFMVIAAEHEMVGQLTTSEQKEEVEKYIAYVKSRTDVERQQEKKVTGVFTGSYALNPFTNGQIPVWIAEYVLIGYGTGAIMAVPADDERDKKFAEKFGLPVVEIIDKSGYPGAKIEDKVGKMLNSGFLNGLEVKDAIKKVIEEIEGRDIGERKVNYKQRDAGYSRQRYWGEPFPIKYNIKGKPDSHFAEGEHDDIPVPLNENELPLILPEVSTYKPTGDGRSPLANNKEWVMKGYETDTMPGYAGSSWYFLRYMDAHNDKEFAAKNKLDYWQSVDVYFGGAEHAVGHLLYSRMWHKFLYDLGYVQTDEPFKKLVNQGMIQGQSKMIYVLFIQGGDLSKDNTHYDGFIIPPPEDLNGLLVKNLVSINFPIEYIISEGDKYFLTEENLQKAKLKYPKFNNYFISDENLSEEDLSKERVEVLLLTEKMSKSKYNVVNPDDVIEKYGADCFRMFEMFLGPLEQSKPWDDKGISGVSNFLKKFWRLYIPLITTGEEGKEVPLFRGQGGEEFKTLHKTLKKIADDIERLNFNTSVSAFMIATNELTALNCHKKEILEPLLIALAPFAPFVAEELWERMGNKGSIHHASYPKVEEKYLVEDSFNYPVSINGKVRVQVNLSLDLDLQSVERQILEMDIVKKWTNGDKPKKFIFVKGKIINVVI